MSVPTGPASIGDISTEFGASGTVGMDTFYAGRSFVPNPGPTSVYQTQGVPSDGPISIGAFLGVAHVLPIQTYPNAGTYYLTVPAGITKAAIRIAGATGGGGGGGKAGGGDGTDVSRGSGGAGGGGGGGGGTGQMVDTILNFSPTPYLVIVVGTGGNGGAAGTGTSYNGTWRTGQDGAAGTAGQVTSIYNAAGTLLIAADAGQGGGGGVGGTQGDRFAAAGGNGGAGYPAAQAGKYNYNNYNLNGYVYVVTNDPTLATPYNAYPSPNSYGGPGGFPGGGIGGFRQDGIGANGSAGAPGFADIQLNGSTSIGGAFYTGVYTGANGSVYPGTFTVYQYVDPNAIPAGGGN